jgi:hypothetical protein
VAAAVWGGVKSFGSGLLYAALFMFFLVKTGLMWLLRKRLSEPAGPTSLSEREWQILSLGSLASSILFLMAGILGEERPWSWFGAFGVATWAWGYYVVSRKAAGKDEAA